MSASFPRAVAFVHDLMRRHLRLGDRAIDATCGNGRDTAILAKQVGAAGLVWAYDIQPAAIDATWRRLQKLGLADRVELLNECHAQLAGDPGSVRFIAFNLGYLPGGEKSITTRTETTLPALERAMGLLQAGGVLAVTVYPGHAEGEREAAAIDLFMAKISQAAFEVLLYRFVNEKNLPPYVYAVRRKVAEPAQTTLESHSDKSDA